MVVWLCLEVCALDPAFPLSSLSLPVLRPASHASSTSSPLHLLHPGKALFIARFTQDFSNCIGIEILHDLHQQAVTIAERYRDDFQDTLCLSTPKDVSVVHDSLLDVDWSDGNVIFANSTCFSDELMHQLSIQAEACAPGTVVITFTKGLTSRGYELLEKKRYKMSWGPATVFIHCRLAANGKSVGRKLNILPSDSITYEEPQPEDDSSVEDEEEEEEDEEEDGGDEDGDEDDGDDENDSESSDVDPQFGTYPPRPPAHATAPAAHAHANANAPPTPPTHTPVVHPTPSPLRVPTPRSSANKADSKTTPDTSFTSVDAKASPSWRTRADSKMTSLSPASPGAKSSISVPTELASQQAFNMLNSPLDEALLNRKRSGRKLVVDSDSEQG